MSIEYKTAYQIYYSSDLRRNLDNKELFFNIYAQFVSNSISNSNQVIILEDPSLDCQFNIVLSSHTRRFDNYFRPWYIFRFHDLKFLTHNPSLNGNPKLLYLKVNNINSIAVFNLINCAFVFSFAKDLQITNDDQRIVEQFQERFISNVSNLTISNLNDELKKVKKYTDSISVSFLAQIVEIRQIQSNKIILKVFDGTVPRFRVVHPINQATAGIDLDELNKMPVKCNLTLEKRANGKIVFVIINGQDNVIKFNDKKPSSFVLFYNAQITKLSSRILIEIKSDTNTKIKRYVEFIDFNTKLGQILMNRINLNHIPDHLVAEPTSGDENLSDQDLLRNEMNIRSINEMNIRPINEMNISPINEMNRPIDRLDSIPTYGRTVSKKSLIAFDVSNEEDFAAFGPSNSTRRDWLRNKIKKKPINEITRSVNEIIRNNQLNSSPSNENITRPINDFTAINVSNKDYEVHCLIVDLFPLNHTAFDLIRMKCSKCSLDETVNILFRFDLKGVEEAASVYYAQYQRNSNMQCPLCSSESCSFYFQIIFYLQDKTGIQDENHRMFTVLKETEAETYLDLNPIKVVANDYDEQYNLLKKIDYLKAKFNDHSQTVEGLKKCYMIIKSDLGQDLFRIKDIFIDEVQT